MGRCLLRIVLAFHVVALAALAAPAGAADQSGDPGDGAHELFVAPSEDGSRLQLITDTLTALGLPHEVVDEIVATVGTGASNRLGVMLDDGALTEADLEDLQARVDAGTLPAVLAGVVADTRDRRDAYREAAAEALDALGLELDPGQPVREVLAEAGIDAEAFIAGLPATLPDPPVLPEPPLPPTPTYPAAGPESTTTLPTTTVPPPPPTTTVPPPPPTTTVPPPPTTVPDLAEYPAVDPAARYPEVAPAPASPPPLYPEVEPTAGSNRDGVEI